MSMLEIEKLTKRFGDKVVLSGLDLQVPAGSIYGFIGKNGAGKTTTMKLITSLLPADGGCIRVAGERVVYGRAARSQRYIGYLPDVPEFYGFMTAAEYLRFCGDIAGLDRASLRMRVAQLLILLMFFTVLGVMNPAIAKLTPKMPALLADTLAESGMQVTHVEANALTSWTQYFKNMPIGLVAFVLMQSNLFTAEYESGTLIPVLTKGLRRSHVVTAKSAVLLLFWSAGNVVSFGLTYLYTVWYWDNREAVHLAAAVGGFFLYGLWLLSQLVLFSCVFRTSSLVLLSTGGCAIADRLLGLLLDAAGLLTGASDVEVLLPAALITMALCLVSIGAGICALNRKL